MSDGRWDLGVKVRQVSEVVCGLCRLPYKTKSVPVVSSSGPVPVCAWLSGWLAGWLYLSASVPGVRVPCGVVFG